MMSGCVVYDECVCGVGRQEDSMAMFEEAVRLSPGHSAALVGLARAQRIVGQNNMAERNFRR